ncbi:MAG: peptidoglycan DD-metalloendopeptidase family protein [Vicinamibacterales bacterium]|nr:peptidoglycan DD-metalloendopeptidase family protein [Vicinamibacterales bacterium]
MARTTLMPQVTLLITSTALLFWPAVGSAQPQERERLETLSRQADERIEALQDEAVALAAQEQTLLDDLRGLERQRRQKIQELGLIQADVEETGAALTDVETELAALEQTASEQEPAVEARLTELYKLGRPGYLRLLLGLDDFTSVMRAYQTVAMLAERDRQTIAVHRATLAAMREPRETIGARRDEMLALQDEARRTRRALDQAVAAQSQLIESIDARRDLTAQLTGELQMARDRLRTSLAVLAEGGTTSAEDAPLPLRPFQGQLPWPVPNTDAGATPAGSATQRGIAIAAGAGQAVAAVHGGRVAFTGPFTGFGNLVIVDHGGQAYSLYGYLAAIDVERGAAVAAGQTVGRVGQSPSGAETVYFELRIDGQSVDPLEWLSR